MLLIASLSMVILMSLVWLWYRQTENPAVIDVFWAQGISILSLGYLYWQSHNAKTICLSILLICWGQRLSLFLWFTRVREQKVDRRYLDLSQNWSMPKPLGFFINFQFQGQLMLLISLPWYFTASLADQPFALLDYLAIFIAIFAIFCESIADYQLLVFKRNHPNKVCNQGFWAFCRHPNYFFEWLCWLAFSLLAIQAELGYIALLSPLILYWIMTKITGPLTEECSIRRRGIQYLNYQKDTAFFFPRIWKK